MLVACGGHENSSTPGQDSRPGFSAAQVRSEEQRLLGQRVRAVRTRDEKLFLRGVDHRDAALMARQRRYFRNLMKLPVAYFGYELTGDEWEGLARAESWGDDVHVPRVQLALQLRGFDSVPVKRTVGLVFSFRDGRARIVSDQSADGKPLFEGASAPWDLTAITVHEETGVLGIFDRGTRDSAAAVTSAVREGISQVDRALPFDWAGHVVVYSVKSSRVLASFTDVPGGSLDHLGALTFPTYAGNDRGQVASRRMLVLPSSVRAGQPFLGRIIRHELSHVAIGVRDDGVPAWVSEGVAEYLGAREVSQRERIIPTAALTRAQTGAQTGTDTMPASRTFNDTDQEWHYALSWMACDYIASTDGESRLWELVDAMHNGGDGTPDAQQDRVLTQVLGYDGRELARRAAARIRTLYG